MGSTKVAPEGARDGYGGGSRNGTKVGHSDQQGASLPIPKLPPGRQLAEGVFALRGAGGEEQYGILRFWLSASGLQAVGQLSRER